jgi:hypothetical protein
VMRARVNPKRSASSVRSRTSPRSIIAAISCARASMRATRGGRDVLGVASVETGADVAEWVADGQVGPASGVSWTRTGADARSVVNALLTRRLTGVG